MLLRCPSGREVPRSLARTLVSNVPPGEQCYGPPASGIQGAACPKALQGIGSRMTRKPFLPFILLFFFFLGKYLAFASCISILHLASCICFSEKEKETVLMIDRLKQSSHWKERGWKRLNEIYPANEREMGRRANREANVIIGRAW